MKIVRIGNIDSIFNNVINIIVTPNKRINAIAFREFITNGVEAFFANNWQLIYAFDDPIFYTCFVNTHLG